MRGKTILGACLAAGMVALAGCHHDKYRVQTPAKDEFIEPPHEDRFDSPREEGYRKTILKGKEKGPSDGDGKMNRGMGSGGPGLR